MPFNLQAFKTRALTAVVFVIVMLVGLLWNEWSFLILFSVIHFGCWIEYQKLVALIDPEYKNIDALHRYSVMFIGWGFMLWMTGTRYYLGSMNVAEIGWSMEWLGIIAFLVGETLFTKKMQPRLWLHSFFGFLYISLS